MKNIKKYLKFIPLLVIVVTLTIIKFMTKEVYEIKEESQEEIVETNIKKEEAEEPIIKKIKVDVKGEVNNPGVYELHDGSRVNDAIEISGGLTKKADTTLLNLSKNLKDEMVIIVYNKDKIEQLKNEMKTTQTVIQYIEKECVCPDTINDACMKQEEQKKETNKETNKEIEPAIDNKISINTASLEELQTLPGIGESKAKAIIEYRKPNGGFKEIEEIKNISGIGDSTFEKFKEYITL